MRGPHAEDAGAVDPGRAGRLGRENDGLFARLADQGGPLAGDQQFGLRPVGVVEVIAVAGGIHQQEQGLDALDLQVHRLGRLAEPHDTGFPKRLAVADDLEGEAGVVVARVVVHADQGRELHRPALEVKPREAVGMGAQAPLELPPGDGHRRARDRLIGLRFTPALGNGRKVQRRQPDRLRFSSQGLGDGCGQRQSDGPAPQRRDQKVRRVEQVK